MVWSPLGTSVHNTIMPLIYFYPLCYAAVLFKFTYYAQEQELWSECIVLLFMYKFSETISFM